MATVDFFEVDIVITIPGGTPNGTSFCSSVSIKNDDNFEGEEQFFLDLQSLTPEMLTIADNRSSLTVVIVDNDCKFVDSWS